MIRRLASTQVIIVHGWKIVVNQRHGVDHFESDGGRHGVGDASAQHFARRDAKDGSNALATGLERIFHTFDDFGSL